MSAPKVSAKPVAAASNVEEEKKQTVKAEPKAAAATADPNDVEDPATFKRITAKLDSLGVPYKLTVHEPILTS